MSFSLTADQIRRREKTVTRRLGWTHLAPGTELRAVVKAMGLKKGERVEPLAEIRVVDVRREPLRTLVDDPAYGAAEVRAEGFGDMAPAEFCAFFCRTHPGVSWSTLLTRIEFEYLPTPEEMAARVHMQRLAQEGPVVTAAVPLR